MQSPLHPFTPSPLHAYDPFYLPTAGRLATGLLGVSIITFALSQLVPIDPVASALGQNAREEQIEAYRKELGLIDRPLFSILAM